MMNAVIRERRRAQRHPLPAVAELIDTQHGTVCAMSCDVSDGGTRLHTSLPLEPGDRIGLRLWLDRLTPVRIAEAQVVWAEGESMNDDGRTPQHPGIGLRFTRVENAEQGTLNDRLALLAKLDAEVEAELEQAVAAKVAEAPEPELAEVVSLPAPAAAVPTLETADDEWSDPESWASGPRPEAPEDELGEVEVEVEADTDFEFEIEDGPEVEAEVEIEPEGEVWQLGDGLDPDALFSDDDFEVDEEVEAEVEAEVEIEEEADTIALLDSEDFQVDEITEPVQMRREPPAGVRPRGRRRAPAPEGQTAQDAARLEQRPASALRRPKRGHSPSRWVLAVAGVAGFVGALSTVFAGSPLPSLMGAKSTEVTTTQPAPPPKPAIAPVEARSSARQATAPAAAVTAEAAPEVPELPEVKVAAAKPAPSQEAAVTPPPPVELAEAPAPKPAPKPAPVVEQKAAPAAAGPWQIGNVRLEGDTLHIDTQGKPGRVKHFGLGGPPRIVVDFIGAQRPQLTGQKLAGTSHSVRFGRRSDGIRVVIDLGDGVRRSTTDLQIGAEGASLRLVPAR